MKRKGQIIDAIKTNRANLLYLADHPGVINGTLRSDIEKAMEEYANPKWIPIEKRLPDRSGWYLVYDPNSYGKNKIEVYWFDKYNSTWFVESDSYHPSHWRPLPQPPNKLFNEAGERK